MNSVGPPPDATSKRQPGLIAGIGSIVAGVIGFGIPVLGMVASCAGIWLGIIGFRRGRATKCATTTTCGIIGIALSVLGIVFWVYAILFESYR